MKRMKYTAFRRLLMLAIATLLSYGIASSQSYNTYDQDHPVIVVCNWDFAPYEFNNDQGEADGFNVQLLTTIFRELKIPCQFVMKEWYQAQEMFEQHNADLIIDPVYKYHGRPYILSRNILNYYQLKMASAPDVEPVNQIKALSATDTLILKENDYSTGRIVDERQLDIPIEYHSAKEAVMGISNGKYKYFIWGKYPLQWQIKTLALDSLTLSDIDIPDGEMRIVGYDKELIDLIDDEYARLEQSGKLVNLHDTWFHPERKHNDTSPIALIVLAGIIIVTIIVFLMSRLIKVRLRTAVRKSNEINSMMTQAVNMGNLIVIEFDMETRKGRNLYGNLFPDEGLDYEKELEFIHPDDRKPFIDYVTKISHNEPTTEKVIIRWKTDEKNTTEWRYLYGKANIETGRNQKKFIIFSFKDITKEVVETLQAGELANKYRKVFQTNLIAMSFYDRHGKLIDINDKMQKLCGFDKMGESFFREVALFDNPTIKGEYLLGSREQFHFCQHMYYPELGLDRYVELRISPITNDLGESVYYITTGRDVTDERIMYLEQKRHDQKLQKTNKAISSYEQQLRYLLEKSDMYVWHYNIEQKQILFSRSLRQPEYSQSLDEYFAGLDDTQAMRARTIFKDYISEGKPFNVIHKFRTTPISHQERWFQISGIPFTEKDGKTNNFIGVVRNITSLIDAQEQLKKETARAENSGKMKSTFLANMTHEIRTPLNAIVGFSDLLPVVETQEERMEFIRIIRNNCDMLMRLINDILEASTMGQALAIIPTEVDFSPVFDDICQTLSQRVQEPGVEFVKDNHYEHCRTILDKGRIQQVLTNFVTNAVKYTHQGQIKVGYHWDRRKTHDGKQETDGLLFYCMDTGAGIPKEKQASVFERFVKLDDFVQGTGLGLSICQTIAERSNGHIGVTSEGLGKGSTFWMWIPCEKL